MPKKIKENKSKIEEDLDLYKDYEPDGKDLAEMLQDEKAFKEENPDYDPEDHCISIQTDIARGK